MQCRLQLIQVPVLLKFSVIFHSKRTRKISWSTIEKDNDRGLFYHLKAFTWGENFYINLTFMNQVKVNFSILSLFHLQAFCQMKINHINQWMYITKRYRSFSDMRMYTAIHIESKSFKSIWFCESFILFFLEPMNISCSFCCFYVTWFLCFSWFFSWCRQKISQVTNHS